MSRVKINLLEFRFCINYHKWFIIGTFTAARSFPFLQEEGGEIKRKKKKKVQLQKKQNNKKNPLMNQFSLNAMNIHEHVGGNPECKQKHLPAVSLELFEVKPIFDVHVWNVCFLRPNPTITHWYSLYWPLARLTYTPTKVQSTAHWNEVMLTSRFVLRLFCL